MADRDVGLAVDAIRMKLQNLGSWCSCPGDGRDFVPLVEY